jgi:hypothetical protein
MTVEIIGRANARSPEQVTPARTFAATAATSYEQLVPVGIDAREVRFRFTSNVLGGNYEAGKPVAHIRAGTGRTTA